MTRLRRGLAGCAAARGGARRTWPSPPTAARDSAARSVGRRLLDAPCSNLGVLRRRVDLKWRVREEEIARLAQVQAGLLDAAAEGARRGDGWSIVSARRNRRRRSSRDRFLQSHQDWRPVPLPQAIPAPARAREGEMILMPGELDTDGTYAFVARRDEAR